MSKAATNDRKTEQLAELQNTLAAAVEELVTGDQWTSWLDFLASFHRYSFKNTLLIQRQRPEATMVAGFRAWQDKGRQVRKGERGIRILGRPFRIKKEKDEKTGEEVRLIMPVRPPLLTVFDISQTDPIEGMDPTPSPVARIEGDDPTGIYSKIAAHLEAKGWNIARETIPGETNGYCILDGSKRIVIDDQVSEAHAAKTLIHEAAHTILHADDEGQPKDGDAPTREIEAESTAYAVTSLAGLDSSGYSVGYVASWSGGDTEKITAAATNIQAAVHELAEVLESD